MAKSDRGIVCVVDDDDSLRRSLCNLLSSVGFKVRTFASAEAFLQSDRSTNACCLLLDVRMPGMGGLALLSLLRASGSGHAVIMLTAQRDAETRAAAMRDGAVDFLEKPFDSDALLDAVQRAMARFRPNGRRGGGAPTHDSRDGRPARRRTAANRAIHVAGGALHGHRHICALFDGDDEEHRVLGSFVKDGVDAGEMSFHIVDPLQRANHLAWLGEEGIDVDATLASGQLEVRAWDQAYLRGDRFEQDAMLALVDQVLRSNEKAGFPTTRLLAQMEWALLDKPGVENLVEYEARANYVLSRYDAPVVCAYDVSKFSASAIVDVLRAHPMVIVGGALQKNPFFVPPDEFLRQLRMRH
jgi:DNA-binding response OmpR family regulator